MNLEAMKEEIKQEEGFSNKVYFDIAYFPNTNTQKFVSYTHNCKDKTDFKLQCT